MKFNPKVSIVIPVYNGSNYLKEAIDSALAQTYKNIEIIVVNDGSKDEGATERIAQSYGDKIRYFAKENGGVATAINVGIKHMTGDYFSWLSHDDYYYQDKIEKQVAFLANLKNKDVFLYANYAILQGDLITPVFHNHEMLKRKPKYGLLRGCVNGITLLFPKRFLDEMGVFDEELRCTQDYDYWRRIEAKYEFVHMEDVVSITRLHPGQDTNVSPRVITEGNVLWIDMIKKLSDKEKVAYEGTLYNFYYEMVKFLETTPYKGALEYCQHEHERCAKELRKQKAMPKVSVVIPFYNRVEKTLRALESVTAQTYKNLEVILVDDGSTEDTTKIDQYVKRHKHIRLFTSKSNQGPAAPRNLAIKNATGEYIAFLDSDDEFMPDKIEKQLAVMLKHNPAISYTAYLRRSGSQETIMHNPTLTGIVVPQIISNCTIATPTVMVRKDLLTKNKLRFDEEMRVGEDVCLWLEIAKTNEILLVDEPLTVVHVGSKAHARNVTTRTVGIKNLLRYVLNDPYYGTFNDEIATIGAHFAETTQEARQAVLHRIRKEGPVVSVDPVAEEPVRRTKVREHVRTSLPYRAGRKLYREGVTATLKAAVKRKG